MTADVFVVIYLCFQRVNAYNIIIIYERNILTPYNGAWACLARKCDRPTARSVHAVHNHACLKTRTKLFLARKFDVFRQITINFSIPVFRLRRPVRCTHYIFTRYTIVVPLSTRDLHFRNCGPDTNDKFVCV